MTEREAIDKIDGLFAWDSGSRGSGIKDDGLKAELRGRPDILKLLLMALRGYDPADGYTIEDAKKFLRWVEDDHGLGVDWL